VRRGGSNKEAIMVTCPIHIRRDHYRGRDPKKQRKVQEKNEAASALERIINDLLLKQENPIQSYIYHEISTSSGYPVELVRELCLSIDGGHNGFTVIRKDLTYKQAMKEMHGDKQE